MAPTCTVTLGISIRLNLNDSTEPCAVVGPNHRKNIGDFMEARVGIELNRFADSTYVVEFIGWDCIATLVKNARNAALGDVQVTRHLIQNCDSPLRQ